MKLLSWNCKGFRNRPAVQELVDIVQAQDPMVVFLPETWSNREQMVRIKERLVFDDLFIVLSDGRGDGNSENAWQLAGFYGEPDTNHRIEGWNMLSTQRKRKNFIKGLKDDNGVWHEDEDKVSDGVDIVVIEEMRIGLSHPYSSGEVDVVVKEMAPLKALGPDGMPPLFYQTYWSDMGMDVHQAIYNGAMP
nr:uncharacterized protein LOC111999339 [Quercus suber]